MKILLIDDQSLFIEGLKSLLQRFKPGSEIICCTHSAAAFAQHEPRSFDLVLLDCSVPGLSGRDGLRVLRQRFTRAKIIFLSTLEDVAVAEKLLSAGASGFIPKQSNYETFSDALNQIIDGRTYCPVISFHRTEETSPATRAREDTLERLSQRQREVLLQVMQGKPNKAIAKALDISEHTVKAHISAAFKVLGVRNRTEAVCAAMNLGQEPIAVGLR